jgi:hypothetical protein
MAGKGSVGGEVAGIDSGLSLSDGSGTGEDSPGWIVSPEGVWVPVDSGALEVQFVVTMKKTRQAMIPIIFLTIVHSCSKMVLIRLINKLLCLSPSIGVLGI